MSKSTTKRPDRFTGPSLELHVLGAAGTVTGSLNLFIWRYRGKTVRFLMEVGLDQDNDGVNRQSRLPSGVRPEDIDFAIISHCHIDHSGWLPFLVARGFRGPVYTSVATADIMAVLLPNSKMLQGLRSKQANRQMARRVINRLGDIDPARQDQVRQLVRLLLSNEPAPRVERQQALTALRRIAGPRFSRVEKVLQYGAQTMNYGDDDIDRALRLVQPRKMDKPYQVTEGVTMTLTEAGHVLGAAVVSLDFDCGPEKKTFVFTGNIGRDNMPLVKDFQRLRKAHWLMTESTYGDKLHDRSLSRQEQLAAIVNEAYERALDGQGTSEGCGAIIIPGFAIGRVPAVLADLRALMLAGTIPTIDVFVEGPMTLKGLELQRKHRRTYNQAAMLAVSRGQDPILTPRQREVTSAKESARLDGRLAKPVIMIGASGMAEGGAIVRHIRRRAGDPRSTVLFTGHQAPGTLGEMLTSGAATVRIDKKDVRVTAKVLRLSSYSGHRDYEEMGQWFREMRGAPQLTLLVHGEPPALAAFKGYIEKSVGWRNVVVPQVKQKFKLV